jgi:hypothetical protein
VKTSRRAVKSGTRPKPRPARRSGPSELAVEDDEYPVLRKPSARTPRKSYAMDVDDDDVRDPISSGDSGDEFIPSGKSSPKKFKPSRRVQHSRPSLPAHSPDNNAPDPLLNDETVPLPNPLSHKRKGHPRSGSSFDASGSDENPETGPPKRKTPRLSKATSKSNDSGGYFLHTSMCDTHKCMTKALRLIGTRRLLPSIRFLVLPNSPRLIILVGFLLVIPSVILINM